MLMRHSRQLIAVFLARIVMPRSFSRSFESIARSGMTTREPSEPAWRSSLSTSVVLPWSTCAMIAMFRSRSLGNMAVSRGVGRRALYGSRAAKRCRPAGSRRSRPHGLAFVSLLGGQESGHEVSFSARMGRHESGRGNVLRGTRVATRERPAEQHGRDRRQRDDQVVPRRYVGPLGI